MHRLRDAARRSGSSGVRPACLVDRVRGRGSPPRAVPPTPTAVAAAVRAEAGGVATDLDVLAALRVLRQEFAGAGPLDELLRDPRTTDVLVCGGGVGLGRPRVRGSSAPTSASPTRPPCAGWPSGSPWRQAAASTTPARASTAGSPTPGCGCTRSSRRSPPTARACRCACCGPPPTTSPPCAPVGTLDATGEALLRSVLAARLALLVSGGTGTGKTTLLNALLGEVDPRERIVLRRGREELRPRHPHVVRLVARPANIEGAGGIVLRDLVRQALRMRPDRLVVGEVRGAEVCDLLAALNTGHDGGAGTVHANSAGEVPARMEALAATGGLPRDALHSQLAAAVQVVLHMRRLGSGARVLDVVGVLTRTSEGVAVGAAWSRTRGWSSGRDALGRLFADRGVRAPW